MNKKRKNKHQVKCPLCGAHLTEYDVYDDKFDLVHYYKECPRCDYEEYLGSRKRG